MFRFYIYVKLSRGLTRIQADEVRPDLFDIPYIPQFVTGYHTFGESLFLTQSESGIRCDCNNRILKISYFKTNFNALNPNYQSLLACVELKSMGMAISNPDGYPHECLYEDFVTQFRKPILN